MSTPEPGMTYIRGMYEGLPYEGPALNLKNDDPPRMRPRRVHTTKLQVFVMSDAEDIKAYNRIIDEVAKGWTHISFEEKQWVPRLETWKILLRTISFKYIQPEDTTRAE